MTAAGVDHQRDRDRAAGHACGGSLDLAAVLLALRTMGVVRCAERERAVANAEDARYRVDRSHERLQRWHDLGRPHRGGPVDRRTRLNRGGCRRCGDRRRLGRDGVGHVGHVGHLGAGRGRGRWRDGWGRRRRGGRAWRGIGGIAPDASTELHLAGRRVDRRRRGGRGGRALRDRLLEPIESIHQRADVVGRRLMGELHQRHLEQQPRVGGVTHLDEHLAEALHRAHHARRAKTRRLLGDDHRLRLGQRHQFGCHQRQEAVAQVANDVLGEPARIAALLHGERDTGERAARVEVDERLDELVVLDDVGVVATRRCRELERAEGVACRAAALLEGAEDGRLADLQTRIGCHPAHVRLELVHRQQVEPHVLRAAANGVADLLRVGGRQHEHHVRRRLLERLQERGLGLLRQHVHLVEDVHLVAAGRAERCLLDEVADRVDTVVAGRVELVDVVAGPSLDRQARLALAAGLAVDRPLAVEHLGQDARRRGLARPAWAREQVRLTLALVDHRVPQGLHDVVLTTHLAEPAGSVAAVQRLGGHRSEPTQQDRRAVRDVQPVQPVHPSGRSLAHSAPLGTIREQSTRGTHDEDQIDRGAGGGRRAGPRCMRWGPRRPEHDVGRRLHRRGGRHLQRHRARPRPHRRTGVDRRPRGRRGRGDRGAHRHSRTTGRDRPTRRPCRRLRRLHRERRRSARRPRRSRSSRQGRGRGCGQRRVGRARRAEPAPERSGRRPGCRRVRERRRHHRHHHPGYRRRRRSGHDRAPHRHAAHPAGHVAAPDRAAGHRTTGHCHRRAVSCSRWSTSPRSSSHPRGSHW